MGRRIVGYTLSRILFLSCAISHRRIPQTPVIPFKYSASRFSFPTGSPVLQSICLIQIVFNWIMSEPLVSSAWIFFPLSSADARYPIQGVSRLERTQKLYTPSRQSLARTLVTWNPLQALLNSILSLHPPPHCFCFSRFLTDKAYEPERVIFGIGLGDTETELPSWLLLIMIFQ